LAAPKRIVELVESFRRIDRAQYNETQLRREFLDPFFAALGWDVENKKRLLPHLREVDHEYTQEVEGSQKTADYAFRRGEKVLFFAEAKKPGISLKEDPKPALQIRRYSFSAGYALGILTDFEEFAVYDGRVEPKTGDKAAAARVLYLTCDEYARRWPEIADVFSWDAVWKTGGYDKFAGEAKGGPHAQVDKSFLKVIEGWRDALAHNVANRNKELGLTAADLNYAVQTTIDRIIFLKVCEDRRLEDDKRLQKAAEGDGVYARLLAFFREADDKYNSGLFHFRDEKGRPSQRDTFTPTLALDDKVLRGVVKDLYDGPYEFGVIPVEIIGQVYEQFLGKVIRVLPAGGVKVEDKPEVKKAGGVYYTPQYIVSYIVANTVGELLKGCKAPADAAKLKVLDPACGSGSFLLGAYRRLMDWHLAWYVEDGAEKHQDALVPTGAPGPNAYRLTIAEKKRILVNNIHGVDIDAQAVEVTKLSLLLRALDGESRESVGAQAKLYKERALPDLGANVKCGNSLIGPDYFEGRLVGATGRSPLQDEDERRRVNPFDWAKEFPAIMKAGGFDAVIGNPPYVRIHNITAAEKAYFSVVYKTARGQYDLYQLFYEKALGLLKSGGVFGMITSDKFAITQYGSGLRGFLSSGFTIIEIVDLRLDKVFLGPSTYPFIMIIKNDKPKKGTTVKVSTSERGSIVRRFVAKQYEVCPPEGTPFDLERDGIILRVEATGKKSLQVKRGKPTAKSITPKRFKSSVAALTNKEVQRYFITGAAGFIETSRTFVVDSKTIIMKKICFSINAVIPQEDFGVVNTVYIVEYGENDNLYALGILNSSLFSYYVRKKYAGTSMRGGYIEMRVFEIEQLPIRPIDFKNAADAARHDEMVSLVERMLDLHKRKAAVKTPNEQERLEREIKATDEAIDKLVYELYGLTEEEIRVVEGGEQVKP